VEVSVEHNVDELGNLVGAHLSFFKFSGLTLLVSLISFLFFFSLLSHISYADTYTLNMNSSLIDSSSTGIWDITNGKIQAPLAPGGTLAKAFTFGDGTDGAFSDGPTQTGISVSGSTVTFNTDVKSDFKFTSFNLSGGITLQVSGSQPLIIRSLTTTTIAGTITLNGTTGAANNAGVPSVGGSAVAGGGAGGNGGSSGGAAGVAGTGTAPAGGGGIGANNPLVGSADEGGGGGCLGNSGFAGQDSASGVPTGGNAGTCATVRSTAGTNFETTFKGGGGGGGGGAYTGAGPISGAGGGGGGGAVRIVSQGNITVSGTVNALGGAGGANNLVNGAHCGGGGGGGAGGSVWLQTAGNIAGAGTVNVSQGAGGDTTNGICDTAYAGGHGSDGIIRADRTAGAVGTYTPASSVQANAISIPFPTGGTPFVVLTRALDFSNGFYDFTTATETVDNSVLCGANGTVTVKYEGSFNGSTYSSPVLAANLSQLNGYPYIRVRVEIATTGANPPCLTGLSLNYQPSDLPNITLRGGLIFCGTINRNQPPTFKELVGDLFMLGAAVIGSLFFRRRRRLVAH
jgi:hypothetical protein